MIPWLRRTLAPGCALHGASQLVESASGLFGDAAADVLTGLGVLKDYSYNHGWRMSLEGLEAPDCQEQLL